MGNQVSHNWQAGDVGILTFHCSDNFGAMLQAYGLKQCLRSYGVAADIVRYEPPFLTGRHWRIPYFPVKNIWNLAAMGYGFLRNLRAGVLFSRRRKNMERFRKSYLIDEGQPRILFLPGLRKLPYRRYVVGSDQIWNPAITYGLRKAYFGAFKTTRKERVTAYAASLGGAALPEKYRQEFSTLLQNLDAVSVRETGAVPYVQQFFPGKVETVLDPVFFLEKEEWEKVERAPGHGEYILAYTTEPNRQMAEYVQALSQKTGLAVVELQAVAGRGANVEATAGPAEFLGYIHYAAYVVTNSFHAAAFSIIFEKQFLVFAHSTVNERLASVLAIHGLEDRLCRNGGGIDVLVDWPAVRARTAEAVKPSREFLIKHVAEGLE